MATDELAPRRRLNDFLHRAVAADPGLGEDDLAERTIGHFEDDHEVVEAMVLKRTRRTVQEHLLAEGYRPIAGQPGKWARP